MLVQTLSSRHSSSANYEMHPAPLKLKDVLLDIFTKAEELNPENVNNIITLTQFIKNTRLNKTFIDIRLRPGIATPLPTHRHTAHYGQT